MANAKRSSVVAPFDWDHLSVLLGAPNDEPSPPGSITVYDFADKRGLSLSAAMQALNRLARIGVMEAGMFYNPSRGRKTKFYWLKEGSK